MKTRRCTYESKTSPPSRKRKKQNSTETKSKSNLSIIRRTRSQHGSSTKQGRYPTDCSNAEFIFQNLPTECKIKIFSFLSEIEKCRSARVCSVWAQIMRTPCLWTDADFRRSFLSTDANGEETVVNPAMSKYKPEQMTRKVQNYVFHLVARKALLKRLTFSFDLEEGNEIWLKLLTRCLHETNARELCSVVCNWIRTPHPYMFADSVLHTKSSRVLCYNKFLKALHNVCPNIESFSMPFDWSPLSLHLLSQFKNVKSLELYKYWVFRGTSQSAITKLLKHFPNLTRLKMDIAVKGRQSEAYPQYTITSDSLKELDIRESNGFFLWSVNLPQLQAFYASKGHWCGPIIDRDHLRIPCLYTVLRNGALQLQRFNECVLVGKDWREFCDPEFEQTLKSSCYCAQHKRRALIY